LFLVLHARYPLVKQADMSWPALVADWRWILQLETSLARIAFDEALLRIGLLPPADIIDCSSIYSMQQLVQSTDAIMVLSESALRDYLKMGLVEALLVFLDKHMVLFG
jgi:DNA-binding transcriptional LysR family regulator